jgi:hypothetical protein
LHPEALAASAPLRTASRVTAIVLACALAAPVAACAQPQALQPNPRIIVQTAADWPSAAEAALRAAQIAGVPMGDALTVAPRRVAMSLTCDTESACQRALQRLAAELEFALSVELDARARLPARPASTTIR